MALARLRKAAFPDPISFTDYLDHNRIALALSLEAAKHERIDFVDVAPWFCADGRCEYESGGLPLYRDGGHLNVRGAMSKVDHLASALSGVGLW